MARPGGNPNLPRGKGHGRPKGCQNKFTTLKQAFINVLDKLGGEEWIEQHARDDKGAGDFMRALVKMLPQEVKADVDTKGTITVVINKNGEGKK